MRSHLHKPFSLWTDVTMLSFPTSGYISTHGMQRSPKTFLQWCHQRRASARQHLQPPVLFLLLRCKASLTAGVCLAQRPVPVACQKFDTHLKMHNALGSFGQRVLQLKQFWIFTPRCFSVQRKYLHCCITRKLQTTCTREPSKNYAVPKLEVA